MESNSAKRQPQKRSAAQLRRDTMQAYGVMTGAGAFIIVLLVYFLFFRSGADSQAADLPEVITTTTVASAAETESEAPGKSSDTIITTATADAPSEPADSAPSEPEHKTEVRDGITYVDGIMIVNKTYSLPADYAPGIDKTAKAAFDQMAAAAWGDGIAIYIISGYRSYAEQEKLYNQYASARGADEADKVSSRAGHSEHQSGLCMDVNTTEFSFEGTKEAIWLEEHCADYGFIIRFPKGKEDITGYSYEPWHIRYVGTDAAKEIMSRGICLEEYLGVTSDYTYSADQNGQQ